MSDDLDGFDPQFEREFALAMSEAGASYRTEAAGLIAAGRAHGRSLRRRRRLSTLAGGVAVLAVVGAGGVYAEGQQPVRVGPASAGAGATPLSGEEFLGLLTPLLPQGETQVGEARGTEDAIPQIRLTLDDGNGAAQFLFWVADWPAAAPQPPCGGTLAPDECSVATTADGSTLVVYKAGGRSDEPAGSKTWSVTVNRPDGHRLMLQEWNRKPLDRGTPVTRTDPPLTTAQLTAVVTDPRWDAVVAALVAPGAAQSAGGPALSVATSGGAAAVQSALASAVATPGGTVASTSGAPVPGAPAR